MLSEELSTDMVSVRQSLCDPTTLTDVTGQDYSGELNGVFPAILASRRQY